MTVSKIRGFISASDSKRSRRPLILSRTINLLCFGLVVSGVSVTAGDMRERPPKTIAPTASANLPRTFSAQGTVVDLPEGGTNVVIRHEAIPGFMPNMTMEFTVHDLRALNGVRIGDQITFQVKANQEESWIEDIKIGKGEPAEPVPVKPLTSLAHVAQLKPGDLFPDAELLDENGARIKFSDFRGKTVAFTFVFTRCPLPDFCPRMNRRFGETREILAGDSQGPTNWQFLSISFDPGYDQPDVLKSYAQIYRGESSDRWLFAAAPTNALNAFKEQLDFRFTNDGASFAHNLRTVVLDSCGRIYRQFDGNSWQADELARAMRQAAKMTGDKPLTNATGTVSGSTPGAPNPHS
jgi:protein SCO1/2